MAKKADAYMDVGARATHGAVAERTAVREHFLDIFNAVMPSAANRFTVCFASICLLALPGCAKHLQPNVDNHHVSSAPAQRYSDVVVDTGLVYSPKGWPQVLVGDLYRPSAAKPAQAWPVVLVVHGGGWSRRTRDDLADVAKALAKKGYAAFNISHRFAPEFQFPEQVYDLQQAMHWLHSVADRYHLDRQRIGGWGYSSGAHLIAMLGTMQRASSLDSPYGGPKTALKAMVVGGIPSDLSKFKGGPLLVNFLDTTKEKDPALYALASPYNHITEASAPAFIYHGGWDRLVPVDHGTDFFKRLQDVGVDSELYVSPVLGHATQFVFDGAAIRNGIRFLDRTLRPE